MLLVTDDVDGEFGVEIVQLRGDGEQLHSGLSDVLAVEEVLGVQELVGNHLVEIESLGSELVDL